MPTSKFDYVESSVSTPFPILHERVAMPTFEQTKDVLVHCQNFHRRVGVYYAMLRANVLSPRVQLLLDYLIVHEEKLAHDLDAYQKTAPARILNTWLQTITVTDKLTLLDREEVDPKMTLDDVLALGLYFDTVLLECYRVVRDSVEFEDVRTAFQNLLEMEEQEKHSLVRIAQSTADY